jgi:hypothetical protein
MARWDMCTSLALIFTVVMSPVEVAFLPAPTSAGDPLFMVNRVVDLIFIVDICVCFFTMYKLETGHSTQLMSANLVWETRLRKIVRAYAKGWFAIDLFSVLPSTFDFTVLGNAKASDECGSNGLEGRSPIKIVRRGALQPGPAPYPRLSPRCSAVRRRAVQRPSFSRATRCC